MTDYLNDYDLNGLYELREEVGRETDSIEAQQEELADQRLLAELDLRSHEADALGEQLDALSDKLGPLVDRIEEIDEEIAWRLERVSYRRMVL